MFHSSFPTHFLFHVCLTYGQFCLFSLFQRLDSKSKEISKTAADITQAVSLSQGTERKKVIQHIRGMYKGDLSASRHWQELSQQLTHDRCAGGDGRLLSVLALHDGTVFPSRSI